MRKLILSMLVSLDGFIEGPNKEFVPPEWSPELDKWGSIMSKMPAPFCLAAFAAWAWQIFGRPRKPIPLHRQDS